MFGIVKLIFFWDVMSCGIGVEEWLIIWRCLLCVFFVDVKNLRFEVLVFSWMFFWGILFEEIWFICDVMILELISCMFLFFLFCGVLNLIELGFVKFFIVFGLFKFCFFIDFIRLGLLIDFCLDCNIFGIFKLWMFVVFLVFSCDCFRSFLVEKVFGFFKVCEGFL